MYAGGAACALLAADGAGYHLYMTIAPLLQPFIHVYHALADAGNHRILHAQAITADQLRSALAAPNFYRWLAFDRNEQDRPVGIGVVFHQMAARCYGDAKVHPEWRRRGIGRMLIDRMVEKARSLDARYLAIDVAADNQDALRFLLTQGFRFRGDVWALTSPPGTELPPPRWPDGYQVTTYADSPDLDAYACPRHREHRQHFLV